MIVHAELDLVIEDRLKPGWTSGQIASLMRLEGGVQICASHEKVCRFACSKDVRGFRFSAANLDASKRILVGLGGDREGPCPDGVRAKPLDAAINRVASGSGA